MCPYDGELSLDVQSSLFHDAVEFPLEERNCLYCGVNAYCREAFWWLLEVKLDTGKDN